MQNILIKIYNNLMNHIKKENKAYIPFYKLIEIIKEDDCYKVMIKVVNKNITFQASPEEILANDALVDQFSPRDIRALTYLGYLGINSPQYKILAKTLSTKSDQIIFTLRKKGNKKIITKTADEILNENNIISNLGSEDAKVIGYTVASETIAREKAQKEELLKSLGKESK
jgi:hypothetical protein